MCHIIKRQKRKKHFINNITTYIQLKNRKGKSISLKKQNTIRENSTTINQIFLMYHAASTLKRSTRS